MTNPDAKAWMEEIVAEHEGDYIDVYEKVYRAVAAGAGEVPWAEVAERHQWLREWAADHQLNGTGKSALVVGCGYGFDAEFVATLGYQTTAFDISPTAIGLARSKHPDSSVNYTVANLLEAPAEWSQAFDLVVEIVTVQALPRSLRSRVVDAIGRFVAPGGRLLVIMNKQDEPFTDAEFGPWPMTRAELEAFTGTGLSMVRLEDRPSVEAPPVHRWLAEFRR